MTEGCCLDYARTPALHFEIEKSKFSKAAGKRWHLSLLTRCFDVGPENRLKRRHLCSSECYKLSSFRVFSFIRSPLLCVSNPSSDQDLSLLVSSCLQLCIIRLSVPNIRIRWLHFFPLRLQLFQKCKCSLFLKKETALSFIQELFQASNSSFCIPCWLILKLKQMNNVALSGRKFPF